MDTVPICKVCEVASCIQKLDGTYFPICSLTCQSNYNGNKSTFPMCRVCSQKQCIQWDDGTIFPVCSIACQIKYNWSNTFTSMCFVCREKQCIQKSDGTIFPTCCSNTCMIMYHTSFKTKCNVCEKKSLTKS